MQLSESTIARAIFLVIAKYCNVYFIDHYISSRGANIGLVMFQLTSSTNYT